MIYVFFRYKNCKRIREITYPNYETFRKVHTPDDDAIYVNCIDDLYKDEGTDDITERYFVINGECMIFRSTKNKCDCCKGWKI